MFVQVIEGHTKDPAGAKAEMDEWGQLMDGEMTFHDLEEPWLASK